MSFVIYVVTGITGDDLNWITVNQNDPNTGVLNLPKFGSTNLSH